MKPSATVIINTYQARQGWLLDAVASYQNQAEAHADILISTVQGDPSLETLRGMENVRFSVSPVPGIYRQLNRAVALIQCPYFCYAADDDIALPHKLASEIDLLRSHPTARIVSSSYMKTDDRLSPLRAYKCPERYNMGQHFEGNFVSDCSMIQTELLGSYPKGLESHFDLAIGNFAHWDFWLRVAQWAEYLDEEYIIFNNDPTWLYRQHANAQHIVRASDEAKKARNQAERVLFLRKHARFLRRLKKTELLAEIAFETVEPGAVSLATVEVAT